MYTNRGRLICGVLVLLLAAFLLAKGQRWAWVLLVTPGLLLFGYYRYGTVFLAFNAYAQRDWSTVRVRLNSVAKPEWLTRESRAYYTFLSGVAAYQSGDAETAERFFAAVDPRALRTDNMRSKFACHYAEAVLASGDVDAARVHLDTAIATPHKADTAEFIATLQAHLAAA